MKTIAIILLLALSREAFGGDGPEYRFLEEKLSLNVPHDDGLLGWMRMDRRGRIEGPRPIGKENTERRGYLSIPLLPIVNSDNISAYMNSVRLLSLIASISSDRSETGSDAEGRVKELQKIPRTDALVKASEIIKFGFPLGKKIFFEAHIGALASADYAYSGVGAYSKSGDTVFVASTENSLFALGELGFLGGFRITAPINFKGRGTLNVSSEFLYKRIIAWQGYGFVNAVITSGEDVSFLPDKYIRIDADKFSWNVYLSYEPEWKNRLSPRFGMKINDLAYSFSPRYAGNEKTVPRVRSPRSIELGALASPKKWLDVGFSMTLSGLRPQYCMEVSARPVYLLRLLLKAEFNRPDLFLQTEDLYSFLVIFGSGGVQVSIPFSYNGKNVGIGFGFVLGSNLWNAPSF